MTEGRKGRCEKSVLGFGRGCSCAPSLCVLPKQAQRQKRLARDHSRPLRFSAPALSTAGSSVTSEGVGRASMRSIPRASGKAEREAIANAIRQPVRFLVSSTFHNNYSKGNVGLRGCVEDRTRKNLPD